MMAQRRSIFQFFLVLIVSLRIGTSQARYNSNGWAIRGGARSSRLNQVVKLQEQQQQQEPPPNAFVPAQEEASFRSVQLVSLINVLLNTFRTDDWIPIGLRMPRLLWEITIFLVATIANEAQQQAPGLYLLLFMLLVSTAMTDLFFWAPLFATFHSFGPSQKCSGGWTRPRICREEHSSRWVVVLQCMINGFVYMMKAIDAMGCFTSQRDAQKVERHVQMMQRWQQVQEQQQASNNSKWVAP